MYNIKQTDLNCLLFYFIKSRCKMKIPNKLLELSRNELMVACRLYSIVNRHTKLTTNGYAVCIKQETIAASCGLSVATVKRVLKALSEKGIHFTNIVRHVLTAVWVQLTTICKPFLSSRIIFICLTMFLSWVCRRRCSMRMRFSVSWLTAIKGPSSIAIMTLPR